MQTSKSPPPDADIVSLGQATGRRLTREEYFNALEVALGVELDPAPSELPRDLRVPAGFRNDAHALLLSPQHVRAYDAIAQVVVDEVDWAQLFDAEGICVAFEESCIHDALDALGRRVLRGPLDEAERTIFSAPFFAAQAEHDTFENAVKLTAHAMLLSPRFIYRLEDQRAEMAGEPKRVNEYELATRVAFLVWNAGPDAELLALAEAGLLHASLESEIRRLFSHPRARRALRQYVEQWLHLDASSLDTALLRDMKEQTYRLFERLAFEEPQDLMRIFSVRSAELSPELATFYGLTPQGSGVRTYDLSALPERVGVLTHASVLAAHTIQPTSSLIDRGLFILNDVLCEQIHAPSDPELLAQIEEEKIPVGSGLSQRERFRRQSENPTCASCHARIDPLGYALENFDATGAYITEDEFGNALSSTGAVSLDGRVVEYANVAQFSAALAGSNQVARCLVEKSVQHAFGRRLEGTDREALDEIYDAFVASGRRYEELLVAIGTHPAFQIVETVN